MSKFSSGFVIAAWLLTMTVTSTFAQSPGQADLDEAVQIKFNARSLSDLDKVADLCEEALEKGLDESGKAFATQMLSATLFEHAERLCQPIFEQVPPDPRWPFLRTQAMPRLEKAVELSDSIAQAHMLIARLNSLRDGDRKRGREAIDKVIELAVNDQPLQSEAYLIRGNLSDDEEERLKNYAKSLELDSKNIDTLQARGLYYLLKGNYDDAAKDFRSVVEIDDTPEAQLSLVQALFSGEKLSEALNVLNQVIETDPENAGYFVTRAQIHLEQENEEAALADLEKALEIAHDNDKALLLRAQLYYDKDEFEKAKKDVQRVLNSRPARVQSQVQALLLRSLISAAEGNFSAAIEDMEILVQSNPDNVGLTLQLANMYYGDERPRKAVELFTQVIDQEEDNYFALRGRANALLSFGKHRRAKEDYDAALKIKEDDTNVLNNLAWLLATSTLDDVRDGKRAIELGLKACELTDYKQPHILSTLASGYAETGDYDSAIKWSKKAVELSEEDMKEDLKKELESYRQGKPWREIQEKDENTGPQRGGGDFDL